MTESGVKQEPEGLRGPVVGRWVVATVLVTTACAAVVAMLLHARVGRIEELPSTPAYPLAERVAHGLHGPVLGPPEGLLLEEAARRSLDEYGWVDRPRGIARIPIDRAMQWFAEDAARGTLGFPDRGTSSDPGAKGR